MLRELGVVLKAVGAAKTASEIGKVDKSIAKLGKTAGKGLSTAAGNLAKLGAVAGGIVASQAVIGIKTLAELETLTNQTNAAIKSTGGVAKVTTERVRKLSQSLEDVTTVDDKVVQSGANVLLTYTKVGAKGGVFDKATKAAVDMAVALAKGDASQADVAATAKLLGKALSDPTKAAGALKKAGVVLDAETQKRIKTLVKQGQLEKAQGVILAQVAKRYGEAGKAAGTGTAADFRRFEDAIEGAQMALASGLLPVVREFSKWMTTKLNDPKVMAAITAAGKDLGRFLNEGLAAVEKVPWDQVGTGMKAAAGAAKGILDAFLGLPPWVQQAVVSGWGLNKLTGGALGDIVGQLGTGLIKGVLGMTAAVVNINAGAVNGPGGVPGIGGAGARGLGGLAGKVGGAVVGAGSLVAGATGLGLFAGALGFAGANGGYRPTGLSRDFYDRNRAGEKVGPGGWMNPPQPVTVNVSVNVTARETAKATQVRKSWSKPGMVKPARL